MKISDRQNKSTQIKSNQYKTNQGKSIQCKTMQDKTKQIQMVNLNEDKIRKNYEELGYKVLHKGCPDFLIFKYDKKTKKFSDVQFIEVKAGSDKLSYEQAVFKKVLKSLGLNYHLAYIPFSKENQTKQTNTTQLNSTQGKTKPNHSIKLIHIPSSKEAQTNQDKSTQYNSTQGKTKQVNPRQINTIPLN